VTHLRSVDRKSVQHTKRMLLYYYIITYILYVNNFTGANVTSRIYFYFNSHLYGRWRIQKKNWFTNWNWKCNKGLKQSTSWPWRRNCGRERENVCGVRCWCRWSSQCTRIGLRSFESQRLLPCAAVRMYKIVFIFPNNIRRRHRFPRVVEINLLINLLLIFITIIIIIIYYYFLLLINLFSMISSRAIPEHFCWQFLLYRGLVGRND
jgi:small-conductance mechanosensitive channel